MKILIAGDSFGAIWPGTHGWAYKMSMSKEFDVTNVSQCGVSEYKIYKQLERQNLSKYDCVIVNHTSPYRVHTKNHPIHQNELHQHCDLLVNDILSKKNSWFNRSLKAAKLYFEYHYDYEYYEDIYKMIRKQINDLIDIKYLSVSHMNLAEYIIEDNHIDFNDTWEKHQGNENHYNIIGNTIVYDTIIRKLK
jgi:hypothetical protein